MVSDTCRMLRTSQRTEKSLQDLWFLYRKTKSEMLCVFVLCYEWNTFEVGVLQVVNGTKIYGSYLREHMYF